METEQERKRATPDLHPSSQPDPTLYLQKQSTLFRLPQELRIQIYERLFSSKRLQWSVRKINQVTRPNNKPRQTVALIRTCRRVRDEIGDSWIGQVHLTFKKPEIMLDVLTKLPVSTVSKIRHLRVAANPLLTEHPPERVGTGYYFLGALLKLLPGLRLDTLTVQGMSSILMFSNYLILEDLISNSSGWKELYYATRESALLEFPFERVLSQPQPVHWQRIIDDRDGTGTKPSVTIYRSTLCDLPGPILDQDISVAFEQDMPALGTNQVENLIEEGEDRKGILVVVKRGFGVDYEEKEGSPLLEKDIRRDAPGMTWQEMKCIDMEAEFPPDDGFEYPQYKWESEEDD